MATSILAIVAALIPFAIWLLRRHMAKVSDPVQQKLKADEKINKAIVSGDEDAVNISINDSLRRLQAIADRDSK